MKSINALGLSLLLAGTLSLGACAGDADVDTAADTTTTEMGGDTASVSTPTGTTTSTGMDTTTGTGMDTTGATGTTLPADTTGMDTAGTSTGTGH